MKSKRRLMYKDITTTETVCDGCERLKHQPEVITGRRICGWHRVYDMDLCHTCYGLLASVVVNNHVPEEIIKEVVRINKGRVNGNGETGDCKCDD